VSFYTIKRVDLVTKTLYEIFYASEKRNGKLKNGDNLNFAELNDEQLVALCVADGVSSCPKDWLASETACYTFIEKFTNLTGAIEQRIKKSVLASHSAVLTKSDPLGMASTFVAAIVNFRLNRVYYLSIGDSRIFIIDNKGVKLITNDDTISIPVKVNNTFVINNGAPVFSHPITKAIGQKEKLLFEIESHPFNPGETIILATDGIHNHGMLPEDIIKLLSYSNISARLTQEVIECSRGNNDDATTLIFRRNDFPSDSESIYRDTIINGYSYKSKKLYPHLTIKYLIKIINKAIYENDFELVQKCLDYLREQDLILSKDILIQWLNDVALKNIINSDLQILLRRLIQKSQ